MTNRPDVPEHKLLVTELRASPLHTSRRDVDCGTAECTTVEPFRFLVADSAVPQMSSCTISVLSYAAKCRIDITVRSSSMTKQQHYGGAHHGDSNRTPPTSISRCHCNEESNSARVRRTADGGACSAARARCSVRRHHHSHVHPASFYDSNEPVRRRWI